MSKLKKYHNNNLKNKKADNIRATIFIPTSNRYKSLKLCLNSLNNQSNKQFNVILVMLENNKNIIKLVGSYAKLDIDWFIQKEKGIINAANLALSKSNKEFFIRIDDDVIVDKDWFKNILQTFDSDKNIGGVTGPTIMTEEGIKSRDLTNYLNKFKKSKNIFLRFLGFLYFNILYENKINNVSTFLKSGVFTLGSNYKSCLKLKSNVSVNNLEACNFSVRTKILKQINGFDTIYTKGLSDYHEADAAFKIKNLGYKLIFNSKVNLVHNVEIGKVEKSRPNPHYRIRNFIIFYFRYFKISSISQLFGFSLNLIMQNMYYFFKFITTKDINNIKVIPYTIFSLIEVVVKKNI